MKWNSEIIFNIYIHHLVELKKRSKGICVEHESHLRRSHKSWTLYACTTAKYYLIPRIMILGRSKILGFEPKQCSTRSQLRVRWLTDRRLLGLAISCENMNVCVPRVRVPRWTTPGGAHQARFGFAWHKWSAVLSGNFGLEPVIIKAPCACDSLFIRVCVYSLTMFRGIAVSPHKRSS